MAATALSTGGGGGGTRFVSLQHVMQEVSETPPERPIYVSMVGQVTFTKTNNDGTITYPACPLTKARRPRAQREAPRALRASPSTPPSPTRERRPHAAQPCPNPPFPPSTQESTGKQCSKKLRQEGDAWHCDAHERSVPEPDYKYLVTLTVADWSASVWVGCIGEVVEGLLEGRKGNDMMALQNNDFAEYDRVVKGLSFSAWSMRLQARMGGHSIGFYP